MIHKRGIRKDKQGRLYFVCDCYYKITEGVGCGKGVLKKGKTVLCGSCSTYWKIVEIFNTFFQESFLQAQYDENETK